MRLTENIHPVVLQQNKIPRNGALEFFSLRLEVGGLRQDIKRDSFSNPLDPYLAAWAFRFHRSDKG
jgi:hypothetical protein